VTLTSLRLTLCAGAGLAALATTSAAMAAEAPRAAPAAAAASKSGTVSELVITAQKPEEVGAVIGDVKPELQLSPDDIQAYGVSSISDLLSELGSQTRSDQGRGGDGPVVLLNGRRISSFREIADLPTEAIQRVDILPEEAALKYGYPANQRVVNIVLRKNFRAETAEINGGGPTEGGQASGAGELGVVRIDGDKRTNLDFKYNRSTALRESSRDLTSLASQRDFDLIGNVAAASGAGEIDPALSALAGQPVTVAGAPLSATTGAPSLSDFAATANTPNASDIRRYRTLSPATQSASANAVVSRVFGGVVATLNGALDASSSDSQRGLPGVSLLVPAGNPYSPFTQAVEVDRYLDTYGPLRQSTDSWTGHLGVSVNKDLQRWRLSFTTAYDHTDSQTDSDAGVDATALQSALNAGAAGVNPFGDLPTTLLALRAQDTAHSKSDAGNLQLVASGPIYTLPAGPVRTSFKLGASGSRFSSDSDRLGVAQSTDFSRDGYNLQANVDVPLASRRRGVLPILGELSFNANVAADQVSDFGTLMTYGFGLNWRPTDKLSFLVTRSHDENAPTQQQLGGATVLTAGTRIYDFQTGQTVDVVQVDGGNPNLRGDSRQVLKIGLNFKPFDSQDLTFNAQYIDSHIKNPIVTFPAATADIEDAFPDRFVRDAEGVLTEVDYRPVNFASQDRRELRWGVNFSKPIGPVRQPPPRFGAPGGRNPQGSGGRQPRMGQSLADKPGMSDAPQGPPPGADGGGGGGGPPGGGGSGGGFGGGGPGGPPGGGFGGPPGGFARNGQRGSNQDGRLQLSLYHTVFFEDRYVVRTGGPVLDMLEGSPVGSGGGQPRNELEARIGVSERGYGAQLNADWKQGTHVDGAAGSASGDLDFSGLTTVNLRLFADLSRQPTLLEKAPWLRGSRLTLSVSNIFDTRQSVHDATGAVPLSYQPAYIDPLGRVVKIGFRKVFI
jgi:iron complex outermembrane receptor protein